MVLQLSVSNYKNFKKIYLGDPNNYVIFAHNFKNIYAVCIIKYLLKTTHLCEHFSK